MQIPFTLMGRNVIDGFGAVLLVVLRHEREQREHLIAWLQSRPIDHNRFLKRFCFVLRHGAIVGWSIQRIHCGRIVA